MSQIIMVTNNDNLIVDDALYQEIYGYIPDCNPKSTAKS